MICIYLGFILCSSVKYLYIGFIGFIGSKLSLFSSKIYGEVLIYIYLGSSIISYRYHCMRLGMAELYQLSHMRWLKLWLMYFLMFMGLAVIDAVGVVKVLLIALKISFFSDSGFRFISRGGFSMYGGNGCKNP